VHPSTSNEEGALLARLAEGLGTGNLDHRIAQNDLSDGAVAEAFGMAVEDIEKADAIVIVGSNLRHELPLVHQRVRKAWRAGAKVHVVNPVDFEFTFDISHRSIVAPSRIADALSAPELAQALEGATRAVVIVGAVAECGIHAAAIRAAAAGFAGRVGAALCRVPQGANAVGLARHGVLPRSRDAAAMLAQPRGGYVIYGIEPGLDFADPARAMEALGGAQVVAFSHFACQSTRRVADVILPIGLLPELDATLTNLDGRDQRTVAGGKLPGEARPGWKALRALGGALGVDGFDFVDFADVRALAVPRQVDVARGAAPVAAGGGLELAVSQAIYRVDGVTRRAAALQAHPLTTGPRITLHPEDAAAAGVAAGGMARVANGAGTATLPVATSTAVARGAALVESGYGATAALGAGTVRVEAA
ncbi:MAG: molybdopterin-dependent oxidoreductase, partial [Gammaproteobacteria bacterium]|nr:molybdopterin-dependent oxidoreductase [Gammaproteobacteria bacterium]